MDAKKMYGDPPKKKVVVATKTTPASSNADDFDVTQRHLDVKKKIATRTDAARANAQAFVSNAGAGTTTDTKTGATTADKFKRTEKRGGSHTEFYGTDGSVTFRGKNDSREVADYRAKNVRDERDVNKRRARNANDTNLFTDTKKTLTSSDKEMLGGIKHTTNIPRTKKKK
jgi:hypothetical protein